MSFASSCRAAGALFVLSFAACSSSSSSPPASLDGGADAATTARATCDAYVACIANVSADALAAAVAVYGKDGTCWKGADASVCETACAKGISTACSGGDAGSSGDGATSGDGSTNGEGGGSVVVTGKLVDLSTLAPIVGATVQAVQSTTTAAGGAFSAGFTSNSPFRLLASKTGYLSLSEQLVSAPSNIDFGTVKLLSTNTANLLTTSLAGYSATGGLISVVIVPVGCLDEGGATLALSGGGASAKLVYTSSGFPDANRTSAESGSSPHAFVYNTLTGVDVRLLVTHPKCTAAPFPVTVPGTGGDIRYESAVSVPAGGNAISLVRVFLK